MSVSHYQVLGPEIPPMLGRERLFEKLCRHLTKATPDHMCVVGPTMFGKSVLLKHLALHFKDPGDHYTGSLYWGLRHSTPTTDAEFRRCFAKQVKGALKPVNPEVAQYLELEEESLSDLIHIVFEELQEKGLRFLAVLDGFDHVLDESAITRNIWDEMRALGQMESLRLVTGSRDRLRELCKTEESRTSDFWEIFYDTPVQVGCFEDHDWSGFLDPFARSGVEFTAAAHEGMRDWTGGVPVLAAALADRLLVDRVEGDCLSKSDVDRVAGAMVEDALELLPALWDDCPIDVQSELVALADGDLHPSEVPKHRRRDIELRGFAQESTGRLRSSCRLMVWYARQHRDEVANMDRLFGMANRYQSNIRGLLELRLEQVAIGADAKLVGYVRKAVRDLRPDPAHSVVWMRSIADRALDLVWDAELPASRSLPRAWKSLYRQGDAPDQLPPGRGAQCHTLRLGTGTGRNAPVARFATKPLCLLIDHLYSVGNFGQHKGGNKVSVPIAAAFCMSAIELCERLGEDMPKPRTQRSGQGGLA